MVIQNGFPLSLTGAAVNGPWVANGSTSEWIAPHANENDYIIGGSTEQPGYYTYQTTFSLTGLKSSSASIAGQFSDDNTMVSILLNGSATGISFKATGSTDYYGWQNFTIGSNANFKAGANTLTFVVQNQPLPRQMNNAHNPCGLQVAMIGQANPLGTVVVNSATTTDSNTVTVTYTVTGNNGTIPLLLKVYRSNSDQVNPAAPRNRS